MSSPDPKYMARRRATLMTIRKGSIPSATTMEKYALTIQEINQERGKADPPLPKLEFIQPSPKKPRTRQIDPEEFDINTIDGVVNHLLKFKADNPDRKMTLMTQYISNLKQMASLLGIEKNMKELRNYKKVIPTLEKMMREKGLSAGTIRQRFSVINAIQNDIKNSKWKTNEIGRNINVPGWADMIGAEALEAYVKKVKDMGDEVNLENQKRVVEGKVTPWKELVEHGKKNIRSDDARLLFSLYTMVPPVRANDYRTVHLMIGQPTPDPVYQRTSDGEIKTNANDMKMLHETQETNWLNVDTGVVKWRDYKNARPIGEVVIKFPKELKDVIAEIVGKRSSHQKKYLFSTDTGKQISEKYLRDLIKAVFGVNGTELRRSYITHILGDYFRQDSQFHAARQKLATQMLHDIEIQQQYLRLAEQDLKQQKILLNAALRSKDLDSDDEMSG